VYGVKDCQLVGPDGKFRAMKVVTSRIHPRATTIGHLAMEAVRHKGRQGIRGVGLRTPDPEHYLQGAKGKSSVSVRVPPESSWFHQGVWHSCDLDGTPARNVNGKTEGGPSWASDKEGKLSVDLKPGTHKLWALGAKARAVTLVVPRGKSPVSVRVIAKQIGNGCRSSSEPDGMPAANAHISYSQMTVRSVSGRLCQHGWKGIVMWRVEDDAPIGNSLRTWHGYAKLDLSDEMLFF